ncbi:putative glycolipid-binding domain-containing protein [Nocardia thailandica]
MTTRRTIAWTGVDEPGRLDAASVTLRADALTALGTSRAADYVTAWSLDTGPGWVTRVLAVTVRGAGWSRSVRLDRDGSGAWSAVATADGAPPADLPAPGLADPRAVAGALDCDLGLCPLTNTMPILRHDLHRAPAGPPRAFVMAWVEVPSLRVLRSDQVYTPCGRAGDAALIEYASAARDFTARLTVDEDGLVRDYEHLARHLP